MFKASPDNRQIRGEVWRLTLPVITEQAFITLMGAVNAMMAARIGKEAAAAIGLIDTLNNIFIAAFSSLAVGGTVVVAHYIGRNELKNAGNTSKQALHSGLILAALIGVLIHLFRRELLGVLYGSAEGQVLQLAYTYLQYTLPVYPLIALTSIACGLLRGAGDTRTPAKVVIIMNIINIVASYLLIFGLPPLQLSGFGVRGAALGIGLARLCGALLLIYILARGSGNLMITRFWRYKPDWGLIRSILNIGVPASLESLLFNAGKLITQTFIVPLGTVPIVANYVAGTLHALMVIPGSALSVAATTLVGQYMGRGECAEAKKSLAYLTKLAVLCLVGLNIAMIPLFPFLASLFNPHHEVVRLTAQLLRITAFFLILWPHSFILPAGMKGAGDVGYTLLVSALSMWLFRISLGYVLCVQWQWGVLGVWSGMYLDWLIRSAAYWRRFQWGNWQKHVIIQCVAKPEAKTESQ
ncbi:putative MATE family efflux protein [Hydrogenispora ethanolica]|uniref:Probable multidrug resistance protein NorM n=1 Tax=Hydrogenispora ethanolica TaxID=1082276 RepID=A0A4R1RQ53_HYDET|nr:MATE family efflux transporter [Hydrogenispora ethanolica]TCL68518.1 putative MATE family efflux protein [Hydrogenispora ethanolica]